jgi:hypothetical protein
LHLDLTQGILLSESADDGGGWGFSIMRKIILGNSHQNSHSPKIKMAADLAASHLADFIGFLAPQVVLESSLFSYIKLSIWTVYLQLYLLSQAALRSAVMCASSHAMTSASIQKEARPPRCTGLGNLLAAMNS